MDEIGNQPPLAHPGRSWADRAAVFLATGLGLGLSPWAPGTIGSLLGLPLAWVCSQLTPVGQLAASLGLVLVGIPLTTRAARAMGGTKDPGAIVYDEIASFPIVFFALGPIGPFGWLLGFALHRLFDITKPPPARQFESLPNGLGIMADDVVAAIYAQLVMRVVYHFWL